MNAQTVNDILGHVSTGAFTALGLLSLRFWFLRRDRPSLWAALCFGTLTAVVLAGEVIPEDPGTNLEEVGQRLLVVVLLLFPYLLFRFAAAFEPASRRVEWLIGVSTVALSAWTVALPDFPQEGEPRSTGFDLYLGALALYWGALSLFVAIKLWRAGRNQPSVARRRMRLLSFAAALLTVAILLAVGNPEGTSWLALITSIVGIASAVASASAWPRPRSFGSSGAGPSWRRRARLRAGSSPRRRRSRSRARSYPRWRSLSAPGPSSCSILTTSCSRVTARPEVAHDAEPGRARGSSSSDSERLPRRLGGAVLAVFRQRGDGHPQIARRLTSLALDRSSLFVREREAPALERADELKTNFIALAAHEPAPGDERPWSSTRSTALATGSVRGIASS